MCANPLKHEKADPSESKKRHRSSLPACVHCHRAHSACSGQRPCSYCVKHGLSDECVDAPRKRRAVVEPKTQDPFTIALAQLQEEGAAAVRVVTLSGEGPQMPSVVTLRSADIFAENLSSSISPSATFNEDASGRSTLTDSATRRLVQALYPPSTTPGYATESSSSPSPLPRGSGSTFLSSSSMGPRDRYYEPLPATFPALYPPKPNPTGTYWSGEPKQDAYPVQSASSEELDDHLYEPVIVSVDGTEMNGDVDTSYHLPYSFAVPTPLSALHPGPFPSDSYLI